MQVETFCIPFTVFLYNFTIFNSILLTRLLYSTEKVLARLLQSVKMLQISCIHKSIVKQHLASLHIFQRHFHFTKHLFLLTYSVLFCHFTINCNCSPWLPKGVSTQMLGVSTEVSLIKNTQCNCL